MNDRCNRTGKQKHGEYMGSGNRKANPWKNTVMGFSEFGVIIGLSVSQEWVKSHVECRPRKERGNAWKTHRRDASM